MCVCVCVCVCVWDIFRTKTDIPRVFLEHECTFCG